MKSRNAYWLLLALVPSCVLNTEDESSIGSASTPYSGSAIAVPGTFAAVNFDRGGEGNAYHDTTAGNQGNLYRTSEDVDIIASADSAGGGYAINNFRNGEWLAYTISVPKTGAYNIAIRVATNYGSLPSYHLAIDNTAVSGPVVVNKTGGWDTFVWTADQRVTMSAGQHVLRVYTDAQYFNFGAVRITAASYAGTPFNASAFAVPRTFPAAQFDRGGEGVAYHDVVAGNQGGQYRTSEDVDIITSTDADGAGYTVNNINTGEWLAYSIDVATAGSYDIGVRASTNYSTPVSMHVELDGAPITSSIVINSTVSWTTFQWVTAKTGVSLSAGRHVIVVASDAQYFNLSALRVTSAGSTTPPSTGGTISPSALFACDFENSYCGFSEQSAVGDAMSNDTTTPRRSSFVTPGRSGSKAIRLHTEPGDDQVHGSGDWERDDLSLGTSPSYGNQGQEEWWAHSIMFPSDFVFTFGVLLDFHHNSSGGSPNFGLMTVPGSGLRYSIFGGSTIDGGRRDYYFPDPYGMPAGSVKNNVWYDFVYHIKWSSGSDGFIEAWLNGKRIFTHQGPTLYSGIPVYLKLANYHTAVGQPSSLIHDRIVRGSSASAVAIGTLQP